MEKEITIKIPECLVDFIKSIAAKFDSALRWRDMEDAEIKGFIISANSDILKEEGHYCYGSCWPPVRFGVYNTPDNYKIFATEKQAKSALAMARISQIMANDDRFGGAVNMEEWSHGTTKYTIISCANRVARRTATLIYHFLAFRSEAQRDLFMEENMDLIKDYFMLE